MSGWMEWSRRRLLAGSAAAWAGPAAQRVPGAKARVRVAGCGVRKRGWHHVRQFSGLPGVEVAALCEVDENVLNGGLQDVEKLGLPKPKTYIDVRRLMADKFIDAVSIATPTSWHALIAIWACQAGKDVYVEKPCSHNWWEGKQLIAAARKYIRVVQHGTQGRSRRSGMESMEKLRAGLSGDIYMARGLCFKRRDTIGRTPPGPILDAFRSRLEAADPFNRSDMPNPFFAVACRLFLWPFRRRRLGRTPPGRLLRIYQLMPR